VKVNFNLLGYAISIEGIIVDAPKVEAITH